MKIGFSTSTCPEWDLPTLVGQAQSLGFKAIEVCAPRDHQESRLWDSLNDPQTRRSLADAGIDLICLATAYSFESADCRVAEDQKTRTRQALELAGKTGCPYVSVQTGSIPRFTARDRALVRIVEALRELAWQAADHRVSLLLENSGSLASSRDIWLILDAVDHPSLRCCWNPCHAMSVGDSSGSAVPRIGPRIAVTHMLDAIFSAEGRRHQYVPLGQGQVDLVRYLVLMHGIASESALVINWPMPGSPPDPKELLPASLAWINQELSTIAGQSELSAYKGDKNAPRFASGHSRATANG